MTQEETKFFEELERNLRPRLTDEFIATLLEAARIVGWSMDYTEMGNFLSELQRISGKRIPLPEPYETPSN